MVKKIIILIASLLGVISTFLPWATVSVSVLGQSASESVNGTEGDGWITLMLFVAIIVITVVSSLKDYKKELPMWAKIATTAVAVICAVIAIIDCGDVANSVSGVSRLPRCMAGRWKLKARLEKGRRSAIIKDKMWQQRCLSDEAGRGWENGNWETGKHLAQGKGNWTAGCRGGKEA